MTTDNAMDPKAPLAKPIYELQNELTEKNIRTELTRIANLDKDNEEDKVISMRVLILSTPIDSLQATIICNSRCLSDLLKTNEAILLANDTTKLDKLFIKADKILNEKQTTRIH